MNKIEMKKTVLDNHVKFIKGLELNKFFEELEDSEEIKFKDSRMMEDHKELMKYMKKEVEKLNKGDTNIFIDVPRELSKHIKNIEKKCPFLMEALKGKTKEGISYSKKIIDILGYNKFSSEKIKVLDGRSLNINEYEVEKEKIKGNWGAYRYVFELGIKVCPYCNRQYITPIYSESGKVRADLDHFFSKAKYPFLSISIYNLIPSCKSCNSSLKGSKEFNYKKNLNPFECNVSDFLEFDIIPKSYQSFYGNDNFEIKLIEKDVENKENNQKARNNCEIFKIEDIYQYHDDIIKNILFKKMIYSNEYIKSAYKKYRKYNKLHLSHEDIRYILLSPYIERNDNDKPLSMLINNIINKI